MAPIDRLPHKLLVQIFSFVAQQKVKRKTFYKYKDGYHPVPSLHSSSQVCLKWRHLIFGNATSHTRALSVALTSLEESRLLWTEDVQRASDLIQKHPYYPILMFLELRNEQVDPEDIPLADLVCLLDRNGVSDRLIAAEIFFHDDLTHHLLVAFANRVISNLEYLALHSYKTSEDYLGFEDVTLESATVLSGSMFPHLPMFADADPNEPFHHHPAGHLILSGLNDLTGLRILNCSVRPTWADLAGILKRNPKLQSLAIQLMSHIPHASSVFDETAVPDIPLSSLVKCLLKADASEIWQFLSIQGIAGLKYLCLMFFAMNSYESMLIPVLKSDLSHLVYLSMSPLCSVTASFLAKAEMPCLVTLHFLPYEIDVFFGSVDTWPHSISLPALSTLRVAGAEVVHTTLFLQALGAGAMSDAQHTLRSLTLDLTLWETDAGSDVLQNVFSEAIFSNVTTLSIEQSTTVVTARFLETILSFMSAVSHLYLSQTCDDEWTPVLPRVHENQHPQPDPFTQLTLLEINTCHTQPGDTEDDCVEYLSSLDEADLVEHLQNRYEHEVVQQLQVFQDPYDCGHEDRFHLNVLRLRIYPGLREETRAKIERMKCSVEDQVDFSYRLRTVAEFDEL